MPQVLYAIAWAKWLLDELEPDTAELARDAFLALGDLEQAAAAETLLCRLCWVRGDGSGTEAHSAARLRARRRGSRSRGGRHGSTPQRARNIFISGDATGGLE